MFLYIRRLFSKNKHPLDQRRRDFHRALVDKLKRSVGDDITIELDENSNIIYIDDDSNIKPMSVFTGEWSQRKMEVTLSVDHSDGHQVTVVVILPEHLLKNYLSYQMHLNQINFIK